MFFVLLIAVFICWLLPFCVVTTRKNYLWSGTIGRKSDARRKPLLENGWSVSPRSSIQS